MAQSARILVDDDEQNIRLTLSALFGRAGHPITTAANGEEAVGLFGQRPFDLTLVDLQMPSMNGMQMIDPLRERGLDTSVIVLTGQGSLESAIKGIHQGAFDYMLKTSDPIQIVERVAAGLEERGRRHRQSHLLDTISAAAHELVGGEGAPVAQPPTPGAPAAAPERQLLIGPLQLDTWHQTATLEGRALNLTPTEFRLLLCLGEHAGQMLSYTQLVRCAQGYETSDLEAGELIKPHIHHLRQKIEPEPGAPRYLLNVRGKGYILQIS